MLSQLLVFRMKSCISKAEGQLLKVPRHPMQSGPKASESLVRAAHIYGGLKLYEESDVTRTVHPGTDGIDDGPELVIDR